MKRVAVLLLTVACAVAQAQTTRPPPPPAKPPAQFIAPVPLPNDALPPEQRLKEFPKSEADAVAPPERRSTPRAAPASTIMGRGTTVFVLILLGVLLTCLILWTVARMVLWRTVRHVATGLLRPRDAAGQVNKHMAEIMAKEATDEEGAAGPSYRALPAQSAAAAEWHRRLVAAVPELSVHPKVDLSALLAQPEDADWVRLARLPLDFVVLRRDGAVVAVVVLGSAETTPEDRACLIRLLTHAGYHVLHCADLPVPAVPALRALLLAAPERVDAEAEPASSVAG